MQKNRGNVKRIVGILMILLIIVAPVIFFGMQCFLPDRESSVLESKQYIKNPFKEISLETSLDGTLTASVEEYLSQQLPIRDLLVQIYTDVNFILGRTKINGVIRTEDGDYIYPVPKIDSAVLNVYANKTVALGEKLQEADIPFSVVTGVAKETFLDETDYPHGMNRPDASLLSSQEYLTYIQNGNIESFSLYDSIKKVYEEGVNPFYKTDHHWNYEGAYAGYTAIADYFYQKGITEETFLERTEWKLYVDPHEFYGSRLRVFGGTLLRNFEAETIRQFLPKKGTYTLESDKFETRTGDSEVFVFPDRYTDGDKYRNYYNDILYVYTANLILTNEDKKDGPVLVVLGDSYSQTLLPMLIEHFHKIYLLDIRKYEDSITEFAKDVNADAVLMFISAVEDNRFVYLNP